MIIKLLILLTIIEIIIFLLFYKFKKKFQWLVSSIDEFPFFSQNEINHFISIKCFPDKTSFK